MMRRLLLGFSAPLLLATGRIEAQSNGFDMTALQLPAGFLELGDLEVSGPRPGVMVGTATSTFMGNATNVMVSTFPSGAGRGTMLALKPTDWSLTRTFPALSSPILDELRFRYVSLVVANRELTLPSSSLSPDEWSFFREIYGKDVFTLVVRPGINLIAAIPAEDLPSDHPLNAVMDALGIEKGTIMLQGSLGQSMQLLTNPGAGAAAALKDVYLRAELPPMRPAGSPEWFNSGQLALEITGLPSLRLVGEMSVNVQDDKLSFFVAAALARNGMTLAGGLQADTTGWEQPFGIEWLTIHKVVLMLGITPTGSVQLGFAGDAVFGEKDIAVAVAIAISPAGVPTNFMVQGESEAGVALSDLAMVQQRMIEAAGEEKPAFPIDALPDVSLKSLGLKFAPKPAPELGIEQGMALKGRLWLPTGPDGAMKDFAGVDVNVSKEALWIRGDVAAFDLGPLSVKDSKLDLTRTRDVQHFMLQGSATLLGASAMVDVTMTRTTMDFQAEAKLWSLFEAELAASGAFNLTNPSFKVHALVKNDFASVLAPMIGGGLQAFADGGAALIAGTQEVLDGLDRLLADREADLNTIRAGLLALRAQADANAATARAAANIALASANSLKRASDIAYAQFVSTSWRLPGLRAQRHVEYLGALARYHAQVGAANGLLAVLRARERILAALPSIDENILLRGAQAALNIVRGQLEVARGNLNTLSQRYAAITAGVGENVQLPLTVSEASFDAELAALSGGSGAVAWKITGTFLGSEFLIQQSLDFSDLLGTTSKIVQELIG
jgi:hypothetical protein